MKIFFFIKDVSLTGGTERVTVNLASLFASKGHDVTIVSYYRGKEKLTYTPSENVHVKFLDEAGCYDSGHPFSRLKRFFSALTAARKFVKAECGEENTVIISQNFFSNALIWLSGAASRAIGCEHFKYDVYPAPVRYVRNLIYKRFNRIVALTDKDANRFKRHLDASKVLTIPNMVAANDEISLDSKSTRIIAVGRLAPQKGFDMLIDAMREVVAKYPDWTLDIFGEGEDKMKLQNQIECCNLKSNVSLKGYSKNIVSEFEKSAFFVLSSRYEGFPLVLVEALGLGMPCVAFDCPEGPSQLLEKGGGVLIPFNRDCGNSKTVGYSENVSNLSQAIAYMIENPAFRDKCVEHRDFIRRELSPDVIYKKWEGLLCKKGGGVTS
jgi:glycosyltransferase involved in cell wall biosynthesis